MALAPPGTILIHWSARLADCNNLGLGETPRFPTGLAAITGAFLGSFCSARRVAGATFVAVVVVRMVLVLLPSFSRLWNGAVL